jgi:hypothetical protein
MSLRRIVLDAGAVTPDPTTGVRKLLAGQPLKKVGNQYVPWLTADGAPACLGILVRSEVFPDRHRAVRHRFGDVESRPVVPCQPDRHRRPGPRAGAPSTPDLQVLLEASERR